MRNSISISISTASFLFGLAACDAELSDAEAELADAELAEAELAEAELAEAELSDPFDVAIQPKPSALVNDTCIVDNDWSGTNWCNPYSIHSGWTYASGAGWNYKYNDVRYTSSWLTGWYYWTAPVDGTATFKVWIPSNKATATVSYEYYCATSNGEPYSSPKTVNQNAYSGAWVTLGSKTMKKGYTCGLKVSKLSGSLMAMDLAKITITY